MTPNLNFWGVRTPTTPTVTVSLAESQGRELIVGLVVEQPPA